MNKNLGRGLNALLGADETNETRVLSNDTVRLVDVKALQPSPFQPRHYFDQDVLNDLVESIKTKGVLQPLLVRQKAENLYEIIGGERRWRASQLAGLTQVPVLVKAFSDKEALEVALIENLQRQDLNALEEAEGYRRLMEEFANTQEDLAKAVGKSRSHVANTMRLLALPETVKGFLQKGQLSSGHARALLNASQPETLAQIVISKGLNVRQTEKLAQEQKTTKLKSDSNKPKKSEKQEECDSLAADLSRILGITVAIKPKTRGGELILSYQTLEQLDSLIRSLSTKTQDIKMNDQEVQSIDQDKKSNDIVSVESDVIQYTPTEDVIEQVIEEDVVSFSDQFEAGFQNDDVISLDKIETKDQKNEVISVSE